MKRLITIALGLAVLAAPASGAAPVRSWAHAQITLLVDRGIVTGAADDFRPQDPLTTSSLALLLAAVTANDTLTATAPPAAGAGTPVTLARLDAALVRSLGLGDVAYRFSSGARRAGLKPPARFGTEVAARLLGLRVNHPASRDDLELLPHETATRAEAAYSVAQVLRFGERDLEAAREAAATFELPPLTPWQRRILQTATSLIGYPYVWGGEDERAERGFDCSGFVHRVFTAPAHAGAASLPGMLRGRTSMELSGEARPAERIAFDMLEPADVLFFGRGPWSKPRNVSHAGIYLGNGWMIHSSRYGVALAPLEGWYREGFAWARRPLAEAGLAGGRTPLVRG